MLNKMVTLEWNVFIKFSAWFLLVFGNKVYKLLQGEKFFWINFRELRNVKT